MQVTSYSKIWDWLEKNLLPDLYPATRAVKPSTTFGNLHETEIYIKDRSSKIVNGLRLRQVRAKGSTKPYFLFYVYQTLITYMYNVFYRTKIDMRSHFALFCLVSIENFKCLFTPASLCLVSVLLTAHADVVNTKFLWCYFFFGYKLLKNN